MACGLGAESENFRIGEHARGLLRGIKDARDRGLVRGNAVLLEPEKYVGFSAHGADFDDLIETEEMRGHAAVNSVGKLEIIFSEGFDERGGVHACCGTECIVADDRIVRGNQRVRGLGYFFAIFLEPGEILLDQDP